LFTKSIVIKLTGGLNLGNTLERDWTGVNLIKLAEKWVQFYAAVNLVMDSTVPQNSGSFLST
jgi:hypothetical protein